MNELDQVVKHKLGIKNYARYTDDFVIVADKIDYLKEMLIPIKAFLMKKLLLELHPKKIEIRRYSQGIDFLGYVILPYHIKVRVKTVKRIMKNLREQITRYKSAYINEKVLLGSLCSYLGVFSHSNAYRLEQEIKNKFWYWLHE